MMHRLGAIVLLGWLCGFAQADAAVNEAGVPDCYAASAGEGYGPAMRRLWHACREGGLGLPGDADKTAVWEQRAEVAREQGEGMTVGRGR